ncbi:MAG: hypothetical protein AAFR93_03505, partial [Pseudomonadota bacterium]
MAKRPPPKADRANGASPPGGPSFSGLSALIGAGALLGLVGTGLWAVQFAQAPFDPLAPAGPMTGWKLARTTEDPQACQAALAVLATYTPAPDR